MALGRVSVNNLNLNQGTPTEVERVFIFMGTTQEAEGRNQVTAVNNSTDLNKVLGTGDSVLKTQVEAARANGGQNWFAYVMPHYRKTIDDELPEMHKFSEDELIEDIGVEGIVYCDPITKTEEIEGLQKETQLFINKHQRRVFFLASVAGPTALESWAEYSTKIKALTDNVAADRVCIVPLIHAGFLGALAGRLARHDVSVADSPMRVATGALIGKYARRPLDKNQNELTMATLKDLHDNGRFTVPQWYPDYDGMYMSDGLTLAAETSDYRVIENVRVTDKAARKIYLLAVARVADRRLNSTPVSIESNKTYFMRPLREMSHSVQFAGEMWPGDIKPPTDESITIAWPTKYKVQVFLKLQPYNAPKEIECNIILDLSNDGGAQ